MSVRGRGAIALPVPMPLPGPGWCGAVAVALRSAGVATADRGGASSSEVPRRAVPWCLSRVVQHRRAAAAGVAGRKVGRDRRSGVLKVRLDLEALKQIPPRIRATAGGVVV